MKRNEFFSAIGISAGMIFMAPVLSSCSKGDTDTTTNPGGGGNPGGGTGGVDFTLDLTSPTYAALNSNGGSIVKDNIIVARTAAGTFVALTSICSHQQYNPISFESGNNRFHCPNHGSNFGIDGSVINGPATSALKKYNVQLTGTNLRIYS
ncbi:MAG: Rieske (2Fe-2S) protein [Prolixibacteraceae bacterium]|jgi:cytochrome b6-f complex iron-sulfur subunit|nr:Rieske (2Fe-2S) protein [Prolixibacteraceae bacterium]